MRHHIRGVPSSPDHCKEAVAVVVVVVAVVVVVVAAVVAVVLEVLRYKTTKFNHLRR